MYNPPKVLISILNWNQQDKTLKCLKSVLNLNYDNYFILIVDNNSISIDASKFKEPKTEIAILNKNNGYAYGHFHAYKYALKENYELLWILNNDLTVNQDSLKNLISAYETHGNSFIYGSNHNTKFWDSKFGPIPILNGSSILLPIVVINRFGFMKLNFFMYGEEIDYCIRLFNQGIRARTVTNSIVYHEARGSTNSNQKLKMLMDYYIRRNVIRLEKNYWPKKKYYSKAKYLMLTYIIHFVKRVFNIHSEFNYHYLDFLGYLHGVLGIKGKTIKPEKFYK